MVPKFYFYSTPRDVRVKNFKKIVMFVGRIEAAVMATGLGRTLLRRQKPTLHGVVFQFFY